MVSDSRPESHEPENGLEKTSGFCAMHDRGDTKR